jgi:hypothetical protein
MDALIEWLELDVDDLPICLACLSFVSTALDAGDQRELKRVLAEFVPILWEEGLAEPTVLALRRAEQKGIPGADAAAATVRRAGPRAPIVRQIVLELAAQLAERARGDPLRMGFQPWPPR